MERFCFDFPREVFPCQHRSGLKEEYGRFSGWLPGGIFKRLGRHDKVYNPLSSCLPLHKPNLCFLPFEKPLCGGDTRGLVDKFSEDQISFFNSTYHDVYVPEAILKELCTEAGQFSSEEQVIFSSHNCLGFRPCGHREALGAVYYPSGADLHQITIGLLMQNISVNVRTDVTNVYKENFSQYSRTRATHCVQDVEWYKAPTAISEISVTSCQGKDMLGVRCHYHCIVFNDSITSKIEYYVQQYENKGTEIDDLDFSQLQSFEHVGVMKCSKLTSAFCLNPQSMGEVLLITTDGTLHLWKLDTGIIERRASLGDHTGWWDCCYGAHPSQLVIADSSSVSLLDLRNSTQQLAPLYSSSSHSSVRALSPHPIHPYHAVITTTESLLLMDTRRPLQPLLAVHLDDYSSSHSPFMPSRFVEVVATDALDTLVLLPSHQQQLLLQYSGGYVRWDGKSERPEIPAPHLTMNPHFIPHYSSLLTGEPADAASYRLTSPLIGSCIVQSDDSPMGIVELSKLGDLFFHQWNYVDNTECNKSIDLPLVDKTLWKLWQQEASLQERQCLPYQELPLTSSQSIDFTPISKYVFDNDDNLCLLCHTYQATVCPLGADETPAPNICSFCGCKLSTTKTSDGTVTSSGAQLLMQSFDLTSLPAEEYGLVHSLWQSWGQDQQHQSEEQSVTSPPKQRTISSSGTERRKRTRSSGTKQIGF